MRVLVTGSAGFIGGHVAEALEAAHHDVVGLDLRNGQDVLDPDVLDALLPGADVVVHQAAKVGLGVDVSDLPDYARVNVYGTAVLLAAMARHGIGRLVLASSMVIYGEGRYECAEHGRVRPGPRTVDDLEGGRFEPPCPRCGAPLTSAEIDEDARPDPRNAYATSKLAQEHLAANWARQTGGRVAALRYHNVYGPRMPRDTPYAGVAAIFRSELEAGRAPKVFEDGRQRRDFVHVRDVARANLAAMSATAPPEPTEPTTVPTAVPTAVPAAVPATVPAGELRAWNIASGTPHTVGDMAAALAAERGGPEPQVTGAYRLGDVRHIVASAARARTELGFHAEIGFEAGVKEFAWS
ncbi:NAD-dependent epimerase/dehydratase family protein [Nonomuraea fuscirosea]|uniref:NAD-dependent epimerase/dehydratase family protein n=1 Tax=Nonomuraea fuscirosea TaxID=1291556 RepID=UPI00344A7C0C